ncbi:MAG: hypothetical protein A2Y17_12300 [Clostridiales bacterium GWF2_38_85]|nr:MAG: hypothetical protein A2Y17_12300 [Clostridiales bacterium GWF2_38_85]
MNYGETNERLLAPTRGGGEFSVTNTIRDIEFDGRRGKTAGMQVIEEQAAILKVVSLCMSQEELALAIPGCVVTGAGDEAVIENGDSGLIPESAYLKNVTMFAKLIGGKYKKITIYKAMHEGGLTAKASQKAEGELSLEFNAHFDPKDNTEKLYNIAEVASVTTT